MIKQRFEKIKEAVKENIITELLEDDGYPCDVTSEHIELKTLDTAFDILEREAELTYKEYLEVESMSKELAVDIEDEYRTEVRSTIAYKREIEDLGTRW